MVKVELTETEARGLGMERYANKRWKRKLLVFFGGLAICAIGGALWELVVGKVILIGGGLVWLVLLFRQLHREKMAGVEFLRAVQNGEVDNADL